MTNNESYLGLDVGTVRIGVAYADGDVRIAIPKETVNVDGNEVKALLDLASENHVSTVVIGLPRNQSGEETGQSEFVRKFAKQLEGAGLYVEFYDESLSSVRAEERLNSRGGKYGRADIDAEAAVIILEDYLEHNREA